MARASCRTYMPEGSVLYLQHVQRAVRRRPLCGWDPVCRRAMQHGQQYTCFFMNATCSLLALQKFSAHWQLRDTHSTGPSSSHPATSNATPNGRLCSMKEGGSPQGGVQHDTRCSDHTWHDCLDSSVRRTLGCITPYHAPFLVVLAKLQCQIAERLRARLHRHRLVVGEAVLL